MQLSFYFLDSLIVLSIYDKSIRDTLDKHAPEICSTRNDRLRQPWYDNNIHEARRERRKYERKWKKSRLECDHLLYVEQRNSVKDLIDKAKQDYFKGVFNQADTKTVFKEVNSLLNRNTTTLPAHESPQELCNAFAEFFSEKVEKIYNTLEEEVVHVDAEGLTAVDSQVSVPNPLTEFDLLSEKDITEYIKHAPGKSCLLDTIPTWFVKQHVEVFAPIITCIVNKSLSTGVFPESLKHAIVSPIIKKPSLNPEILKNNRPVSSIIYLSKIIEKHAVLNIANHIALNHLKDSLQSAYKPVHSTETAKVY